AQTASCKQSAPLPASAPAAPARPPSRSHTSPPDPSHWSPSAPRDPDTSPKSPDKHPRTWATPSTAPCACPAQTYPPQSPNPEHTPPAADPPAQNLPAQADRH